VGWLLAASCAAPPPGIDAGSGGDVPSGGGAVCGAPVEDPGAGLVFGTSRGALFPGFTLPTCDDVPYTFYDDANCPTNYTLTVVSIGALWCGPCQMESALLTDRVTNAYADAGVRVVQILVDGDTPGSPLSPAQCWQWVSTYGLVNPELMDPGGAETNAFFPDGTLPSTVIVDRGGLIRFYENGASMGLVTLTAAIESLLCDADADCGGGERCDRGLCVPPR
jgi:thiol-disulfide isomerase/thioredoxin